MACAHIHMCGHTILHSSNAFQVRTQRPGPLWQNLLSIPFEITILDSGGPPHVSFDFPYMKPLFKDSWEICLLSGSCAHRHVSNKALTRADAVAAFICNPPCWLLSSRCSEVPTAHHIPSTLQHCLLLLRQHSFQPACCTHNGTPPRPCGVGSTQQQQSQS